MQIGCPHCDRVLEFSGENPSFCAYCGKALPRTELSATAAYQPSLTPDPPVVDWGTSEPHPRTVGAYRLIRPLGEGGMGIVYEAEEAGSGRRVALKLVSAEFGGSTETLERFRQEGRLASAIAHPRCVFVLAADEEAGRPYIVMELMPGSTLKDLVDQQGPLEPADAVAKILDVIEGLQEAHRLGVIHRDVKPSNCFLEADGRVKIGDFGLAKSLEEDTHLTRTGLFLGTPLFASPEQIRKDPLNEQTDVYSVAATLYFLLTGRAPFQGSGDAAAILARISADPPPSMRTVRPQISPALDKVVLRGLERQRERRWRTLEDFRRALLPFLPSQLSIAGMGLRLGAYLIDFALLAPVLAVLYLADPESWPLHDVRPDYRRGLVLLANWLPLAVWYLYFFILESRWRASVGKRLLGLRICTPAGGDHPGRLRLALRTLVFTAALELPPLVGDRIRGTPPEAISLNLILFWSSLSGLGLLFLLSTMRARNGYRGLHEWLSGTRVVALPRPERPGLLRPHRPKGNTPTLIRTAECPERVGTFVVEGALHWKGDVRLLLGRDSGLGRQVWIRLRPPAAGPLSSQRQDLNRAGRLRWLTGGRQGGWQWDAFLAPSGWPLTEFIKSQGRLSWPQARPILQQLTAELAQAARDGTLPAPLTVDQVWIQPTGQLQVIDTGPSGAGAAQPGADDQAATFLRQAAVFILEGCQRTQGDATPPIRAPLPDHAVRIVNRLLAAGPSSPILKQVQADLAATQYRPREITPVWRATHLLVLASLWLLPVLFMLAVPVVLTLLPAFSQAGVTLFIEETQENQKDLEVGSLREFVVNGLAPSPVAPLTALVQREADVRLSEQLQQVHGWAADEWKEISQDPRWSNPTGAEVVTHLLRVDRGKKDLNFRRRARELAARGASWQSDPSKSPGSESNWPSFVLVTAASIGAWPVFCICWAFLFRGGWTLWAMGLILLRSDGRKAARWQCAWRSLLLWTPVCGLLGISAGLEIWYGWEESSAASHLWVSWLSWACWGLTAALFPIYAGLALLFPNRSLHDWLAGTYVVPR
jgi:uncharacterized RDD family membrane protein YckC